MGFPQRYDSAQSERFWQEYWARERIYEFAPTGPRPIFAIDTPPPTVSGDLHIGHVYSYVQAEAMARFWRMRGFNVYYPFGFDDNGLPTERFVERSLGVRARDLGRAAFIAACLDVSRQVEDRFEAFWKRLGMSVDWRLRYSTIDDSSRRIAQWSFLDLYRKGLIARAQAPNPWCSECQTAIAQAEIDDAERTATFYTLAFTLGGQGPGARGQGPGARGQGPGARGQESDASSSPIPDPRSLIPDPRSPIPIATTRPELLPACVAVFVHPEDARFAHLVGGEAILPLFDRRVPILADPGVDPHKGTGAVMCCTFGDTADVAWWRAHNLPLIPLVTRQGRLGPDGGPYEGLPLAEARQRIVADLQAAGRLLDARETAQTVRIHERCKTPLEILQTSQWFVRILDAKQALLEAGRRITWRPAYMRARYEHWIEHLSWDWCISRQRFYGVPFPAWHCDRCGAVVLADESQLPIDPTAPTSAPPHACTCGSAELRPDEDVMDTWATSSLSPLIAALRWNESRSLEPAGTIGEQIAASSLLPMQLRPQAHDIIRTWAFYTIVKSHYHAGMIPWETIMISGHGLDPAGRSIHKSHGNSPIEPSVLIERYSADAVRYWACSASTGADQPINEETMRQGRRLITKLWNAARLIASHLPQADATDALLSPQLADLTLWPADRALLSWLQRLIARATVSMEAYEYASALENVERFFWSTLCDNYLEWVKGRLYDGNSAERRAAQITLAHTLLALLKLFAPFMPHIVEEIHRHLFAAGGAARSIHTSAWPQPDDALHDAQAEQAGEALLALTASVRRFKSEQRLSLGHTLAGIAIAAADPALRAALERSAADLRSVTRARDLAFAHAHDQGYTEVAPGVWIRIMI